MTNTKYAIICILILTSCKDYDQLKDISETKVKAYNSNEKTEAQIYTEDQQEIIDRYVYNCADKYSFRFNHHRYQECLDEGIKKGPNISYLWQQKAMPYFKARKYEVGMQYLDKAVELNKVRYLPYRGFIKCIFSKNYKEAIKDFEAIKAIEGNSIVMDHSYNFYLALSHLQLNHFEKAEEMFQNDVNAQIEQWGEKEYHHLSIFYLGVTQYEQKKWKEAIQSFDKTLEKYSMFSEVMYYKSTCLYELGQLEESREWYNKAIENGKAGNTISEANSLYENYPYQILWN
jgi:tetratricopeptide (TPR) repeat protein